MVGGGEGAFIGAVHRMAARLDGRWDLIAGAFQSDSRRSAAFGAGLGLDPARCYGDYRALIAGERERSDRADAIAIVTPNASHHPIARAALEAGFAVICEKPMTVSLREAEDLSALVARTRLPFVLTHTYSGYPMVREARHLARTGALGVIRIIQAEYAQDWLAGDMSGNKQAEWRGDPDKAGPAGALGDIATHAFHLAEYVTGLRASRLAADLTTFVPGRRLDDNVHILLQFGGARGILFASQVATGAANGLKLRVFGESGALEWAQETPETLVFTVRGEAPRILRRGGPGLSDAAARATRTPAGHPEGYIEGFSQLYADAADIVLAHGEGRDASPLAHLAPGVADGVRGLEFIEAALASSRNDGMWTRIGDAQGPEK
jgi:predicted dehydrogenase